MVRREVVNGKEVKTALDAARAGVTVPYSPEFADLESNTGLLKRLSEITGGKVYTESDEDLLRAADSGEIFRDAPATVRALLPFWYWLVAAAGIGLLFDVGVRRVAVEPAEVRAALKKQWTKLRQKRVAESESEELDRLLRVKEVAVERIDRDRAARRFEPTATPGTEPKPVTADDYVARSTSPPPPQPAGPPPPAVEAGDTFEKLMRAKRRAQQQRREDEGERPK
jgi:hypothetical protein